MGDLWICPDLLFSTLTMPRFTLVTTVNQEKMPTIEIKWERSPRNVPNLGKIISEENLILSFEYALVLSLLLLLRIH